MRRLHRKEGMDTASRRCKLLFEESKAVGSRNKKMLT